MKITISQFSTRASHGKLSRKELEASLQALKEVDEEIASRKVISTIPNSFYNPYQSSSQPDSTKKYDFRK